MQSDKIFSTHQFKAAHSVLSTHEGMRLDQFLKLAFKTLSRAFLCKKIERGDVVIYGRDMGGIRPSTRLKFGQVVEMKTERENLDCEIWRGKEIEWYKGPPEIIYEDEDMVVINKPPFMTTHPTGKHLFYCATVVMDEYFPSYKHYSVHRLDRETSGLLVLGKNKNAAFRLANAFEEGRAKKCYLFLAKKQNAHQYHSFTAHERLLSDGETSRERIVARVFPPQSEEGKVAETAFQFLMQNENFITGLAFPKTGRQHQIRAHAAYHSFPLLGDKLYLGGIERFIRFKDGIASEEDHNAILLPRHALHAFGLKIPHPQDDKKILDLRCKNIPEDFAAFFDSKDLLSKIIF